jgi:opacity protein-like surface antigen
MKKSLLMFLLLLPLTAVSALAQESRQDISVSGSGIIPPFASGNAVRLHATVGYGGLISYRYLLTPHGGLELNYQYNQNVQHFTAPDSINYLIHDRFQEFSGAYVYSFNFKNLNPFIEGGDAKTKTFGISRTTDVGVMYGAGVAYEISPSFDIRAEFRGLVMKTPTFNYPGNDLRTNVYYNIYNPVVGIAYHF